MKSKIDSSHSENLPVVYYEDRLFRLIASLLAAIAVCSYGFDGSMLDRVTLHYKAFLVVFGFSFAVAWGLLAMIRFFSIRFDRRYDWINYFVKRLILQFLACWLLPMAIVFLLSLLFFAAIGVDILKTNYLHEDYLLTGLLLVICNVLYALAFFALRNSLLEEDLNKKRQEIDGLQRELEVVRLELKKIQEEITKKKTNKIRQEMAKTPYIINSSKAKTRYQYSDIAYFYSENSTVMVQLMNGEDPLPANENSLVSVEQNSEYFFRSVSRQYVVALHAIEECKERGDGGLVITLLPLHIMVEVPKKREQELEDWILQKVSIEKE